MLGRPQDGITHGRNAVALLERSGERWWLGQALNALAYNLLHVGDVVPALAATERLREVGEAIRDTRLQAYAAWTAGRIYTVMGESEAGIASSRRGVELAPDPVARALLQGWLGVAHRDAEDAEQAITLLEDAIARYRELSGTGGYRSRQVVGMFTAILGEAYLLRGAITRADELTSEALATAGPDGWPVAIGYAERAAGRVASARGALDEAEGWMRRSERTFLTCEAPCQAALSRVALAEVLAARGDLEAARTKFESACNVFEGMPAPRLVERTRRLAGALRVTPP